MSVRKAKCKEGLEFEISCSLGDLERETFYAQPLIAVHSCKVSFFFLHCAQMLLFSVLYFFSAVIQLNSRWFGCPMRPV